MIALRDLISGFPASWLAISGLVIGSIFGFAVCKTNFCAMGSISDIVAFGDYRRFRSWMLAAAIAIVGAQLLDVTGVVALRGSMYLSPSLNWVGAIVGGLMFGFGMVFAGGCGSKNLVRLAAGDLRSLFTLMIIALFAYMTIGGLLAPVRAALENLTVMNLKSMGIGTQGIGDIIAAMTSMRPGPANGVVAVLVAVGVLAFCLSDAAFRGSRSHLAGGVVVGLCIVMAWAATGLAADDLADRPIAPASLTFVRPTADTFEWLQRFTAAMMPGFGIASVLGTLLGGGVGAAQSGQFRLMTFSSVPETLRCLAGAALMGTGGVMALGCTIGQGLSGISTLAVGSFLATGAIIVGGISAMNYLIGTMSDEN